MHIPDGFLSPQTCAAAWVASAPVWYVAWKHIKGKFEATTAAHLGIAGAFVFLLQMINVPIPGGTSGHAVGAALVTIALGPAAGILAVSMALLLQAVVFGDGGIWAYGANVLTMAIAQSVVAWVVWRAIAGDRTSGLRTMIGAFAAAYAAALGGALTTGTLLGIQPMLFKDAGGSPLYFPLGLGVSIPAMLGSHLLIGFVEGTITVAAVRVLQQLPDFKLAERIPGAGRRRVMIAVAAMVFIVPLGIILPAALDAGDPWGEWSPEEAAEVAGVDTVPAGLAKYSESYNAPVPDYQFTEAGSMAGESGQYIAAGLLGVLLTAMLCLPLHKVQQRRLARIRNQG